VVYLFFFWVVFVGFGELVFFCIGFFGFVWIFLGIGLDYLVFVLFNCVVCGCFEGRC